MRSEFCQESDLRFDGSQSIGTSDVERMEWQANHFASCLLLQKRNIESDLYEQMKKHGISNRGFGALYVDDQPANLRNFHGITDAFKQKYGVSRSVVKNRLQSLGLLKDARTKHQISRIRDIMPHIGI